jgi:hypothetical protein
MKNNNHQLLFIIIVGHLLQYNSVQALNIGTVAKAVSTGIEVAGTVVDTAMGIAGVGVALWGSDKDKERFNKAVGITSVITSLARGDVKGAQEAAEQIRGTKEEPIHYNPLSGNDLADADIVPAEQAPMARSIGDRKIISNQEAASLRAQEKVITVDDLKIAQFGNFKEQLVFLAKDLPQNNGGKKLYKILNGREFLFVTNASGNTLSVTIHTLLPGNVIIELGTIKSSPEELRKGIFIGTTNGQLSAFYKEENLIKKTILIRNMNT